MIRNDTPLFYDPYNVGENYGPCRHLRLKILTIKMTLAFGLDDIHFGYTLKTLTHIWLLIIKTSNHSD